MTSRIFILDRSGSMESCRADTIGGYNAFIDSQKQFGGTMTLILFDHEYSEVYVNKPIADVEPLTSETFVPRGSTALLDAIGQTMKKFTEPATCIILTDGQENSSHVYTRAHVKDLIEHATSKGWTFTYLGANQDAFEVGASMGIQAGNTMNFDTRDTPELFRALSATMSVTQDNH
jgi:Mg-chelatase subunit ChlD